MFLGKLNNYWMSINESSRRDISPMGAHGCKYERMTSLQGSPHRLAGEGIPRCAPRSKSSWRAADPP